MTSAAAMAASCNGNLSFLLLIPMLFCVTAAPGDENPVCGKINSVQDICTLATFPTSCYDALVKYLAPNVTTQPEIIYTKSVQLTGAEVSRIARDFSENGTLEKLVLEISKDNKAVALSAMRTCRELLALAVDNVNKSSLIDGSSLVKSYDNLRSRLVAATTDIQTCQNRLGNLAEDMMDIAFWKLKNSVEYTINTLAIATVIGKCEKPSKKHVQTANVGIGIKV